MRYERPGDLVHIDTSKVGRIERVGHRITGNRRGSVDGAGRKFLFVAADEQVRIGCTGLYRHARQAGAAQLLENNVRALPGVRVRRVLTDNGSALRS